MASWRATASQQAQDALDKLFSHCVDWAIAFLKKNKEFYPFGMAMSTSEEITQIATTGYEEEKPLSLDIISDLIVSMRMHCDRYNAIAIVSDVVVFSDPKSDTGKSDAIRVSMEHQEGIAIEIIVLYKMHGLFKKEAKLGEITSAPIESFIWTS